MAAQSVNEGVDLPPGCPSGGTPVPPGSVGVPGPAQKPGGEAGVNHLCATSTGSSARGDAAPARGRRRQR